LVVDEKESLGENRANKRKRGARGRASEAWGGEVVTGVWGQKVQKKKKKKNGRPPSSQ